MSDLVETQNVGFLMHRLNLDLFYSESMYIVIKPRDVPEIDTFNY